MYLSSDEKALSLFENDAETESMKAYVNFISEMGRTYPDRTETARRYRIFKENYDSLQTHMKHE